jgi:hypothetical protein
MVIYLNGPIIIVLDSLSKSVDSLVSSSTKDGRVDSGAATSTHKLSNAKMQTCEDDRKEPTECEETVEAEHVAAVGGD